MIMARYMLFRKSVTSYWKSVPRRIKILVAVTVALLLILPIIVQSRKTKYLRMTYDFQEPVENVLNIFLQGMKESASKDYWRPLNIEDSMIFSAYLDDRPEVIANYRASTEEFTWGEIRIIAIMPLNYSGENFQCVYKYDVDKLSVSKIKRKPAVSTRAIRENWGMKYSAFFILCELTVPKDWLTKLSMEYLPTFVTVSINDGVVKEESFVRVHYPLGGLRRVENTHDFLAVCTPAFHHRFNRTLNLIEFIEYYQMMGAGHLTFYNSSISSTVDRVLKYYESRGNITVLPWNLPSIYVFEKTLRVHGIFAALNDCLYRNSFYKNFKYVANVDVDEFIVPREHNRFTDMMNYLELTNVDSTYYAGFIIRNVIFYHFYADDNEGKESGVPYLLTQAKTKRVLTPNEAGIRSKYIVRSKDVVELGNHEIWEYRGQTPDIAKFGSKTVDERDVLLHHYRACEMKDIKNCISKPTTVDKTAHKFIHELGRRVSLTCYAVFGQNGCSSLNTKNS